MATPILALAACDHDAVPGVFHGDLGSITAKSEMSIDGVQIPGPWVTDCYKAPLLPVSDQVVTSILLYKEGHSAKDLGVNNGMIQTSPDSGHDGELYFANVDNSPQQDVVWGPSGVPGTATYSVDGNVYKASGTGTDVLIPQAEGTGHTFAITAVCRTFSNDINKSSN